MAFVKSMQSTRACNNSTPDTQGKCGAAKGRLGNVSVYAASRPELAVNLARVEPAGYTYAWHNTLEATSYSYNKKDTKKCFQQTTTERKNIKRKKETQRHKSSAKPSAETTVPEPTTETCKLGKGKGRREPTFLPHLQRERASRPTPAPPLPGKGPLTTVVPAPSSMNRRFENPAPSGSNTNDAPRRSSRSAAGHGVPARWCGGSGGGSLAKYVEDGGTKLASSAAPCCPPDPL